MPESTKDVQAKPTLQLLRHRVLGQAGLCRGRSSSVCPAAGAERSPPAVWFVLTAWGWKSQGKHADEKFLCKILSAECRAASSPASPVSCPAGTPRGSFVDGLCGSFSFYFNFFACNRSYTECVEALLRKYVSGNALLSLILVFFLFFAC